MIDVSVIIPVKNGKKYIDDCLDAIFAIDYPKDKYEILVIDNGSTDSTVSIAKSWGVLVYKKPGLSISALRNYGAKMAKGAILAFVDIDCLVDKSWMKAASRYFSDEKVVCFGATSEIHVDSTWVQKAWYINKQRRKEVQEVEWLESMNLFVKKTVFDEIGGFNERLETCEDVDLCYRLGQKHTIISDKRIKSIHLGEAKTLKEFFKKEVWRGQSNLKGIREHGITLKEAPSIILPLYYLLVPLYLVILLYVSNLYYAVLLTMILCIGPAFLISLYVSSKTSQYRSVLDVSTVYIVYFAARAFSLIKK